MTQSPYLLINVPLTDPTAPYHSIPYLISAARAAGFVDGSAIDANVEALNYLAQPRYVDKILAHADDLRQRLEAKCNLTRLDAMRYQCSLASMGMESNVVEKALGVLRSLTDFYDYSLYRSAVMVLRRWLRLLSLAGYPDAYQDFSFGGGFGNLSSINDLTNPEYLAAAVGPFTDYFSGPFRSSLLGAHWHLVGLSVNYLSQLPFAAWLVRYVRKVRPDVLICVGGTEVSDIIKCLRQPERV